MSDLGWRADGIERALANGGVELELYRRPGFTGGMAVRRSSRDMRVSGCVDLDPDPPEADEHDGRAARLGPGVADRVPGRPGRRPGALQPLPHRSSQATPRC